MPENHQTVFFDIDNQVDFLLPVGALYVPGAEKLIPALGRLTEFARSRGIPIISDVDAHAPQDPEFRDWPPHCVRDTLGQRKVAETLLPGAVRIPNDPGPLPQGWERAPQLIVEKQTLDVFENHTIARILEERRAGRYVVYGVVTEYCVRLAVAGLLEAVRPWGAQVEIVTEAIRELDAARGRQALDELRAAGARTVTLEEALTSAECGVRSAESFR